MYPSSHNKIKNVGLLHRYFFKNQLVGAALESFMIFEHRTHSICLSLLKTVSTTLWNSKNKEKVTERINRAKNLMTRNPSRLGANGSFDIFQRESAIDNAQ